MTGMTLVLLHFFLTLGVFPSILGHKVDQSPTGEFVAGTYILTQKSLDEAPYRYAGVLRQILDSLEVQDPPEKEEISECSTQYKIEPSGK